MRWKVYFRPSHPPAVSNDVGQKVYFWHHQFQKTRGKGIFFTPIIFKRHGAKVYFLPSPVSKLGRVIKTELQIISRKYKNCIKLLISDVNPMQKKSFKNIKCRRDIIWNVSTNDNGMAIYSIGRKPLGVKAKVTRSFSWEKKRETLYLVTLLVLVISPWILNKELRGGSLNILVTRDDLFHSLCAS